MDSLSRVARIIFCENASEEFQWEAAQLIAEELAAGKSTRQLAKEIGKGKSHVAYMAKCWNEVGVHLGGQGKPPFNEVYHSPEVRGVPAPVPAPTDDELTEFESDMNEEQKDWDSLPAEEEYEGVKEGDPELTKEQEQALRRGANEISARNSQPPTLEEEILKIRTRIRKITQMDDPGRIEALRELAQFIEAEVFVLESERSFGDMK